MSTKLSFLIRKGDGAGQAMGALMPLVDVAVSLIMKGDRILVGYNDKWGAFTLPMSKRRTWTDPSSKEGGEQTEDWEDVAIRAATEWTGCTTSAAPEFLVDLAEFQQSDRDTKWKRYHLQVFKVDAGDDLEIPSSRVAEWLTADEIADESRRPISPTARHIVAELQLGANL